MAKFQSRKQKAIAVLYDQNSPHSIPWKHVAQSLEEIVL
jgi:hypothetical protein